MLTYQCLVERVWGDRDLGDMRPMRTLVNKLRRKLGDTGARPTYIFTERRVGYRMPKGEAAGKERPATPQHRWDSEQAQPTASA